MAMHHTASLPSMQAQSHGRVKCDNKKKEYQCSRPEKVCDYPGFARVKWIFYASALRMARAEIGHLSTQISVFPWLPDVTL